MCCMWKNQIYGCLYAQLQNMHYDKVNGNLTLNYHTNFIFM